MNGRNHREEKAGCGAAGGADNGEHGPYARVEWGYWVDGPDGFYLEDPANHANDGWGNGELGDESIPLYALCGLAAIAAAGAVVMHRKRQRVG